MNKPIRVFSFFLFFLRMVMPLYQPAWNVLSSAMKIERERGQRKKKKNFTWHSS
jgi:hypothetical protein